MLSSNVTGPEGSEEAEARLPEFSCQIQNEMPFLRRAARRWHRDKANADDLVQDVLVQLLLTRTSGSQVVICALGFTRSCATDFSPT